MSQVTSGNGVTSVKGGMSSCYQSIVKTVRSYLETRVILLSQGDLVIDIKTYGSNSTWFLQDAVIISGFGISGVHVKGGKCFDIFWNWIMWDSEMQSGKD